MFCQPKMEFIFFLWTGRGVLAQKQNKSHLEGFISSEFEPKYIYTQIYISMRNF